jgi:hypothetical protein
MPTVVKTWPFASTVDGWVDVGDSPRITPAADGANGNPAGSYDVVGTAIQNPDSERMRSAAAETWETWTVPTGSTVTSVVMAIDYHRWGTGTLTTWRFRGRIVDGSGVLALAADSVDVSPTIATDGAGVWNTNTGSSQNVLSGSQPSNSSVRFELQVSSTGGAGGSLDVAFDNIKATITYTAGGGGIVLRPSVPFMSSGRI